MFKFNNIIKMALLFILVFSLIACGSNTGGRPNDVREEIWEAANERYEIVSDYYYNNEPLDTDRLADINVNHFVPYENDDSITENEKQIIKLASDVGVYSIMISNDTELDDLLLMGIDFEKELEELKELLNR